VWKELENAFRPGHCVLEIGCGTGVDACFLAERGVTVVACDKSPRMVAVTTRRVEDRGQSKFVHPHLLAAEDLASLRSGALFDGAFSNFGVLNCVEDLGRLARNLTGLLRPGATALLCWMGPRCLWEMTWYIAQGKPGKAFRRLRRGGVTARVDNETSVRVHYPSVRSIVRVFQPEFRLKSIKGIGISVPPSYVEPWINKAPRLLQWGLRGDSLMARCPGIRVLADHILLEFQREDA
jgi:SAM-dependent methyltransferase